jgi:succinate dehydrogenase / fumarate reductase, cytochrome b subunit
MRYRPQPGTIAWLLHRICGVGVVLFLFLHIADITLLGWGPELFNKLLFIYRAPPFRIMEVVLLGAVLYHALNGIRIIIIDFWRTDMKWQRGLFYGELALFAVLAVPAAYLMLREL